MATETADAARGSRFLVLLAATIVVIAGLRAAAEILVPFALAVFLSLISLPCLNQLQRWKVPTVLAVILTVLLLILVLTGILFLIGGSINAFTNNIPRYQERIQGMALELVQWLEGLGVELSRESVFEIVNPGVAFDVAGRALNGIAQLLKNLFLVVLIIVFILAEAAGFPAKLGTAFGSPTSSERYDRMRREIQRYLGIKTIISLITGIAVGSALTILGIDYAVLWGFLAFILNYVPNIGSILAAIAPTLLALIQYGPGRAITVAAIFIAVNIAMGNFIEPHFMGRRLGLSTLVIILSLIFWGWVWGPVGMLLSVPLTMIVKIMLENTDDLRWLAVLLDKGSPDVPRVTGRGV
jgi:predicted PurR-regulated permease PerM